MQTSAARAALTAAIAVGGALVSYGQTIDKPTLSLDGARTAIAGAKAAAARLNAPGGVVAVVGDGGNLMALERLDGTFAAGANISIGKARTAALFKKPTRVFEELINKSRTAMTALNDFTPLQGGIPITIDGHIVGGIGVSGAASAQQEEDLATAGAVAVSATPDTSSSPVPTTGTTVMAASYVSHVTVQAAFLKGLPLVETSAYKVHASRRDRDGQAEVHARDTDIIYVVDGTATLITGGTVASSKAMS